MADLFRKSLIDKISSPEQLDKAIVVTSPATWIGILGAGIMVTVAVVWAVFGKIPVNVKANGVYTFQGGNYSIYSEVSGVVIDVSAEAGDELKKGDVVATLDTGDLDSEIKKYEERIAAVSAVTLESENDVVTADNKAVIDVKNQLITVSSQLDQDQELLDMRLNQLSEQRSKTTKLEEEFLSTELAYYNSMMIADTTGVQIGYSEAQSNYGNAVSYLASANSSLDQARMNYNSASRQLESTRNAYKAFVAEGESLQENYVNALVAIRNVLGLREDQAEQIQTVYEQVIEELSQELETRKNDPSVTEEEIEELENRIKELANTYQTYTNALNSYESYASNYDTTNAQYQSSLSQQNESVSSAEDARDTAQSNVDRYASEKETSSAAYENAKQAYITRMQEATSAQQQQNKLGNEYNQALSNYNSAQSTLLNLEDAVAQLEAQVIVDQKNVDRQIDSIAKQFTATKESILSQLNTEYQQKLDQKEKSLIRASVNGTVSEILLHEGSIVGQGTAVARILQAEEDEKILICYASLSDGRKIKEGMKVLVYPSTVNRQEYGHMEAVVEHVDDYVTSNESMQEMLGSESLVQNFGQQGPVVAVICKIREDATTASGYYWSSNKGKTVNVETGTMVETSFVVEEKKPISMLIPYLKEKLTVKAKEQA